MNDITMPTVAVNSSNVVAISKSVIRMWVDSKFNYEKHCFLVGEIQKGTMREEAKGKIGGFNKKLTGSEIKINGILHERCLFGNSLKHTFANKKMGK